MNAGEIGEEEYHALLSAIPFETLNLNNLQEVTERFPTLSFLECAKAFQNSLFSLQSPSSLTTADLPTCFRFALRVEGIFASKSVEEEEEESFYQEDNIRTFFNSLGQLVYGPEYLDQRIQQIFCGKVPVTVDIEIDYEENKFPLITFSLSTNLLLDVHLGYYLSCFLLDPFTNQQYEMQQRLPTKYVLSIPFETLQDKVISQKGELIFIVKIELQFDPSFCM